MRGEGACVMAAYTLRTTVSLPFDVAVAETRAALAEQGFGILTETDLASTLHAKLGVDLAPQVILGACRPALAHQAIQADPAIATVLPATWWCGPRTPARPRSSRHWIPL